ncbi:elongation factor EF-Ts [Candidatus Hodgkinia cicadicola]|uniref:Elongation factor EF-Ts n=1 Tax=Candidatus Hodgkinia cicadicola TaxID=573658 RepID=A0ABX4MHG0_9HYPH|nr:elongation factor EF-Ts [Candidatus Hodgkinia cicadicola]PIM96103.1 elongation factor EF-Ts [Candidatus Hodgkinia cicadicola]
MTPIKGSSFTFELTSDPVVITLNKLTNLSLEDCTRIVHDNNNDLEKSLKQAYLQIYKPPFNIINGSWFSTIIPTRSKIYLFKLYSNTPIYNNRNNWELRNILNKMINNLPLNTEKIFKLEVVTGIMLHSCIGLKYDATMFGFYLHERVNDSIYKGLALTITSSTPLQRSLIPLTRFLCRLSYFRTPILQTNILSNITNDTFEANFIKTTQKLIQIFNKTNNCTTTLHRVFIIK